MKTSPSGEQIDDAFAVLARAEDEYEADDSYGPSRAPAESDINIRTDDQVANVPSLTFCAYNPSHSTT
ncbi:MAG: hypothetical protein M3541_03475 [Acidobacteriota bacterium]|nr:hypothetical protein [Acidobacteriota bacterium]